MLELRILNGLHRGATLPLDERPLVIGASDDADVVLVDPDIETEHARLILTARGWLLSTLNGAVLGAEHNRPQASLDLQTGNFARLGHVWLTVADSESPWENPPPEPAQNETVDAAEAVDTIAADSLYTPPDACLDAGMAEDEPYRDSPLDDPQNMAAEATGAGEQPAPTASAAGPRARRGRSRWLGPKMIFAPLALVTVLSACAAYTMTSRSKDDSTFKTPNVLGASSLAGARPGAAAMQPARAQAPKPSPQLLQMELREAFRQRLKEVDLLKRFELHLKDNAWTMQAALDDDEAARFGRILATFVHAHNIKFPVHAKIGSAEAMLPFRIRQVVSGSNASVVTQDGNRLYVGDEYRGMRLVAVDGNNLRFEGERKIKVKW